MSNFSKIKTKQTSIYFELAYNRAKHFQVSTQKLHSCYGGVIGKILLVHLRPKNTNKQSTQLNKES